MVRGLYRGYHNGLPEGSRATTRNPGGASRVRFWPSNVQPSSLDGSNVSTSTPVKNPYLRDPDVQLMLRVQEGDEAAFAQLVENYRDRLVSVFTHLLGDSQAAEDLAQEAFLRVYRVRHGYEPTAKFSTWMYRIAGNLASNTRRSKGRRRELPLKTSESGPQAVAAPEEVLADKSALMPTRQFDRHELQERVREALGTLNERQQMAVLLHRFEEMSYADIGASMELSTSAVKSLLARAREQLRIQLEPYVS